MEIWWLCGMHARTHVARTDTHVLRSSWILSRTTRVSQHQKGKTNLDLLKQEIVSGCGISWAICKSSPWPRHMTMPAFYHSAFYRPDALPAAQPTASKHWRQALWHVWHKNIWNDRMTAQRNSGSLNNWYVLVTILAHYYYYYWQYTAYSRRLMKSQGYTKLKSAKTRLCCSRLKVLWHLIVSSILRII